MPRKLRIEYPGACYHVINRGNYRSRIFLAKGASEAFEKVLFQACERLGWHLSAFVIMSNHFHLAIETPEPNLSVGMKWLQGTWVMRNNRFRRRTGRPFQGRFKAILLEPAALATVTSYIHLNPHRAGIEPIEQIGSYRWSSLYHYLKKDRPPSLNLDSVLSAIGGIKESVYAHKKYVAYLRFLAENEPERKLLAFDSLSKGWCVGSIEFKKEAIQSLNLKTAGIEGAQLLGMDSGGFKEARELQWEKDLQAYAKSAAVNLNALETKKSASEKVLLGCLMKQTTSVSNSWLAKRLSMGQPASVSQFVRRAELARGDVWIEKEGILSRVKI